MNVGASGSPMVLIGRGVTVGYHARPVLNSLSFEVVQGEVLAILGHNGAGKSTLLRAIAGLLAVETGSIVLDGQEITRCSASDRRRKGLAYVPQGHQVFTRLRVRDQILLASVNSGEAISAQLAIEITTDALPELIPLLNRQAGGLSGGERQLVALAMGLVTRPRILLLDEPSYGLAPKLVSSVMGRVRTLASGGTTILIAEQRVREALTIADSALVIRRGEASYLGPASTLADSDHDLAEVIL